MRSERFEKLIACNHTGAYIENDIAVPSQIKLLKVYRAQASCPCWWDPGWFTFGKWRICYYYAKPWTLLPVDISSATGTTRPRWWNLRGSPIASLWKMTHYVRIIAKSNSNGYSKSFCIGKEKKTIDISNSNSLRNSDTSRSWSQ